MRIVVPKEVYPLEKRVLVLPDAVKRFVQEGNEVFVQVGVGAGIHISDEDYKKSGAQIVSEARDLYNLADMIVKVKAPLEGEFSFMHDCILFSMFHADQNPAHIYYVGLQGLTVVEIEKICDARNERMITQTHLTGQAGVLYALRHFDKVPSDLKVVILGYGHVASGAIDICNKLGMQVKILRKKEYNHLREYLRDADLLINGIAWPESARKKKEYIVTRDDIKNSNPGMVVLDLSVDFPNPIETVKPTTYSQPYYLDEGRVHISIYGYPGLFPVTSSRLYSEQSVPLISLIATNGGLKDIAKCGDNGAAIAKSILNPQTHNWQQYKPETVQGSKIE